MAELIVALDVRDRTRALALVDRLGDDADFYKVGFELFSREGPAMIAELLARGKKVFLDMKLHDIPNTVAGGVRSAAALGVDLLTVHATGGPRMLEAAVAASEGEGGPRILAVTVLTSLEAAELGRTWGREVDSSGTEVVRLARLAREAGVHGVVASAREAGSLRAELGPDALLVTPGIRLAGVDAHDQLRVATPSFAVLAGADHLVVGRAITGATDPSAALFRVRSEMEAA